MKKCHYCGSKVRVIDSRENHEYICRRRYECDGQEKHRYTTVEVIAAEKAEQLITFNGETKTVREWADSIGITPQAMKLRLGTRSVEEALTVSKRKHPRRLVIKQER